MPYSVYARDNLHPAESLKIERSLYFKKESADISSLTALPEERLITMREESAKEEQKIFENLCKAAAAWDTQAGQTILLDKAIEYLSASQVKHTSNKWEKNEYGLHTMSNMVYKMTYSVYEGTKYDRATQKTIPVSWYVTWFVSTNNPDDCQGMTIACQLRKRFADKTAMEKYLYGRIRTYKRLFTEISPPIPQTYEHCFHVNGQLLPGYTVEGEEAESLSKSDAT